MIIFSIFWWLTGSPFIAMLLILLVLYALDLRFVRLLPDITKPYRRWRRLSLLKNQIRLSPHDTSAKLEVARLHMEKRQYEEALTYLEGISSIMQDSPEFLCDKGICYLKIGRLEEGQQLIDQALKLNPRVKYGEPYLRLAEAYAKQQQLDKALASLEELATMNMSSCEVYYKLGEMYAELVQKEKSKQAYREAVEVYRGLPSYKRRQERRWALLAWVKSKL